MHFLRKKTTLAQQPLSQNLRVMLQLMPSMFLSRRAERLGVARRKTTQNKLRHCSQQKTTLAQLPQRQSSHAVLQRRTVRRPATARVVAAFGVSAAVARARPVKAPP